MVRRFFLSAVFLAATLLPASAQHRATVISQHYTTAEGLPSNNVMCVLKDRDGFLWFGTWYGLCRFDGTEFSAYNKPRNPNTDFPPRKVESMAEDAEGQLWLKTVDWRLYVFNRHTERFQAVSQQLKKYTKNLQIIKIQRTNEGRILLLCKDKTLLEAYTDKLGNIHISKLFDSKGKIHPPQPARISSSISGVTTSYLPCARRATRQTSRRRCLIATACLHVSSIV